MRYGPAYRRLPLNVRIKFILADINERQRMSNERERTRRRTYGILRKV